MAEGDGPVIAYVFFCAVVVVLFGLLWLMSDAALSMLRERWRMWRGSLSVSLDSGRDLESTLPCELCRLSEHVVFAQFGAIARRNRDLDRTTKGLAGLYLIPEETS